MNCRLDILPRIISERRENKRRCSLHNSNQRFKVGWSNRGEKVKTLSSSSSSSSFGNGLKEKELTVGDECINNSTTKQVE